MTNYKFICETCIGSEDAPCILRIESAMLIEKPTHCPFKNIHKGEDVVADWQDKTEKEKKNANL